jgi:hypothetical protein
MKMSLGAKSLAVFAVSVLFLILLTLFESSLLGLSIAGERILSVLLLVVPALIGVVFGVLGILRKEDGLWMSALGILLNALFALFHIFVISFAG